jgi:hypothetical protein
MLGIWGFIQDGSKISLKVGPKGRREEHTKPAECGKCPLDRLDVRLRRGLKSIADTPVCTTPGSRRRRNTAYSYRATVFGPRIRDGRTGSQVKRRGSSSTSTTATGKTASARVGHSSLHPWRQLRVSPLAQLSFHLSPSSLPPYLIPLIPSTVTSNLKMVTVRFSETSASTNRSTRRLSTEYHHYRRENLKSHIISDNMTQHHTRQSPSYFILFYQLF